MTTLNTLQEANINPHDTIDLEEIDCLLHIHKGNLAVQSLILLIWDSGATAEEIAGLKIRHLDLHNGVMAVRNGDNLHLAWFGDYTAKTLQKWLSERPDTGHEFVFFNPMDYQPFSRAGLIKYVGILLHNLYPDYPQPGLNFHSFRNMFAMRLIPHTPPRSIAIALGLQVTPRQYAEYQAEAANAVMECKHYRPHKKNEFFRSVYS